VLAAVLAACIAGLSTHAAAAPVAPSCRPTEGDAFGPFQGTGATPPLRAKIGTGYVLTGRVLRYPECTPIRDALVDFWQAGSNGYTRNGRGSVITGRSGTFRFEGPLPAASGGEPHVHIRVAAGGYKEVLLRYVIGSGFKRGHLTIVLEPLL
jgi:protocatechuate 3,4-dioxygenase beta subunit